MAVTIDSKVVELKFDNRDFEQNTKTTMSTLDKLKAKLDFTGAEKGLTNISKAAQNVNMNGLTTSIAGVETRLNAMSIAGVTAMANIANSAVEAGKRLASALFVAPKADGFKEYELTINAVKTLVNSTGKSIDEIKEKLKSLDDYADKTVYSTADMFNNIYKFTNAGVDLDTATTAMIGIANATALAGQGAQQASIAYYNLAQSISMGYLTTIDYKSLNLANIATKEFKQHLADAAVAMGTLKKKGDNLYAIGNETYTLQALFAEALSKQWATTDVMMKVFKEYGDAETEVGKRAWAAAQNVTSLSMMMESLKASAGTGWKETWDILIGNLDEATQFWSSLYHVIEHVIHALSNFRNSILDNAFSRSFGKTIETVKKSIETVTKPIATVAEVANKATESYDKLVKTIIRGNWDNGVARHKKLAAAGYNYYRAQNMVNEALNNGFRYSKEKIEAEDKLLGITNKVTDSNEQYTKSNGELRDEMGNIVSTGEYLSKVLLKMSDEQLRSIGYTDDQIAAFRELDKISKKIGVSIDDLLDHGDKINGRWLVTDSIKNFGETFTKIFDSIGSAFSEIFSNKISDAIFNFIAGMHRLSNALLINDDTANKIKNTFKGLFAALDMILTLINLPIKIAFKLFTSLLKAMGFGVNTILDVTSAVGNAIVAVHDWLDSVLDFSKVWAFVLPAFKYVADQIRKLFQKAKPYVSEAFKSMKEALKPLLPILKEAAKALGEMFVYFMKSVVLKKIIEWLGIAVKYISALVKAIKETEGFQNFIKNIQNSAEAIKNWVKGIKEADNVPKYIFEGLINGIKAFGSGAIKTIGNIATLMIEKFKEIFGIHSPSKEMYGIGSNIIQGLVNGIKSAVGFIFELLSTIGSKILNFFKNFDLGSAVVALLSGGLVISLILFAKAISGLGVALEAFGKIGIEFSKTLAAFRGLIKAAKIKMYSSALKDVAISIAILTASVLVLSNIEDSKLKKGIVAIAALAVVIGALFATMALLTKSNPEGATFEIGKLALMLLALGIAISLMGKTVKNLSEIEKVNTDALAAFGALLIAFLAIALLAAKSSTNMVKVGGAILAIGASFLLISKVVKTLGTIKKSQLKQGLSAITLFTALITGLMASTKLITGSKNVDKIGKTILSISLAFMLMAISVKILGKMNPGDLTKGVVVITLFEGLVIGLIAALKKFGPKELANLGLTMIGVAGVIMAMTFAIGLLSMVEPKNIAKGLIAIGILSLFIQGLIKSTKDVKDAKSNILAFTGLIAVLTISLMLLSLIDPQRLIAPVAGLSMLIGMIALALLSTKGLSEGNIIDAAIKIGIMVGVVAAMTGLIFLLTLMDPGKVVGSAIALGSLLLALTLSLLIISKVKINIKDAAMGLAGLLAMLVIALAAVGVLAVMSGIQNAEKNAAALVILMTALSVVLLLTTAVGAIYGATAGIAATGLLGLVALIGIMFLAIGLLATLNQVDNVLTNIGILTLLMTSLSGMLIILGTVGPLALMGTTALYLLLPLMSVLVLFATSVGVILTYIPQLEEFMNKGLGLLTMLAGGIGNMLGAFIGGVISKVSDSLPHVGEQLSDFMNKLIPFINGAKLIDGKVLAGVGIIAASVIALTVSDLITGISNFLSGGDSFTKTADQLSSFMEKAKPFLETASTIPEGSMNGVKAMAEAILCLTAGNLLDGLTRFFGGNNSLSAFSSELPGLGENMAKFVENLGNFGPDQISVVESAGKAISALAEAADNIPNEGGLWAVLVGDNGIGKWAGELGNVGTGIANFVSELTKAGITKDSVSVAETAANVITKLADAAKNIPNEGGLWAKLAGDNSLATFAGKFYDIAKGISGFIWELQWAQGKEHLVDVATNVIWSIVDLAKANIKDVSDKLPGFASTLPYFGEQLKGFIEQLASVNITDVVSAGNNLTGIMDAVKMMVDTLNNSVDKNMNNVTLKFEELGIKAGDGLMTDNVKGNVEGKGYDFVKGFADGISKNSYLINGPVNDLGQKALSKLKESLDSHSPSKETYKIGGFFDDGFVDGIKNNMSDVYNTSYTVGNEAKKGLSKAISKINDMLSSNMDTRPVIRPVLDLSDVSAGANEMNSMFMNPSLATMSNLGSISAGMNLMNNNKNADLISAISRLSKDLGNKTGNTYNINGITYDDGSAASNAVQDLINAVEIGRRM